MAPKAKKDAPSKKAAREKQKTQIDDLTFGLKNKNKSKKVQQFVSRAEHSVKNSGRGGEILKNKEANKEAKLVKKIQEEELRSLFSESLTNQYGKKKSVQADKAEALGLNKVNQEVKDFLDGLSSDEESDASSEEELFMGNNANETIEQNVQIFREKTIEDIIEEQREKLAREGKKGTPVNAETFKVWREAKLKRRQEEAEARVKAEQAKKKGGKGLSVLNGKELFKFNVNLFVDDESAFDEKEDSKLSQELALKREQEEEAIRIDAEKANAEQDRLAVAQKLEMEAREYKEEERRRRAAANGRKTISLLQVLVNQVVFQEDEEEDLELFVEYSAGGPESTSHTDAGVVADT